MELKEVKHSFYKYLKQLNEKEILILMNYLSLLIHDFNSDYTKFKDTLNSALDGSILSDSKDWKDYIENDDIFETNCLDGNESLLEEEPSVKCLEINSEESESSESTSNETDSDEFQATTSKKKSTQRKSGNKTINRKNRSIDQKALDYLIEQYEINRYPNQDEIHKMVEITKLKYNKIFNWFQERRISHGHTKKLSFSKEANDILENAFKECKFPSREKKFELVSETKLDYKQIETWFKRKRQLLREELTDFRITVKNLNKNFEPNDSKLRFEDYLLEKYEENRFPTRKEMEEMAGELQVNYRKIYYWFERHRLENGHALKNYYHSKETTEILEREYEKNNKPSREEKKRIADLANLTFLQVEHWLNRKRYKSKKS